MPQIPSAEWIEAAHDQLMDAKNAATIADQSKELREALGEVSEQLIAGYNLGLQVARVIIRTSVQVEMRGIDPDAIL